MIGLRNAAYKVPDGKLLKVRLTVKDGTIKEIVIMGDFFMHPEDVLPGLESLLVGLPLDQDLLTTEIEQYFAAHSVTLIGATAQDVAQVIMMAK